MIKLHAGRCGGLKYDQPREKETGAGKGRARPTAVIEKEVLSIRKQSLEGTWEGSGLTARTRANNKRPKSQG